MTEDERQDAPQDEGGAAPDLVLGEGGRGGECGEWGEAAGWGPGEAAGGGAPATETEAPPGEAPAAAAQEPAEGPEPRSVFELAADARYQATGKRKTSV